MVAKFVLPDYLSDDEWLFLVAKSFPCEVADYYAYAREAACRKQYDVIST
jgi:hypothetical protein